MDIEFLVAATKRDRNGPYFSNVRHHLSVSDNILLYDDKVVIPKQQSHTNGRIALNSPCTRRNVRGSKTCVVPELGPRHRVNRTKLQELSR